ncbi:MAG: MFS transporter, partial [Candidatus Dormibacteraceae bacterium]
HGFARGLDVDGFLLSAIGLAGVVFGLVEGRTYGWLRPQRDLSLLGFTWHSSAPISAPAVAIGLGLLFLILFVIWERHRARVGRSALMDLRLFTVRSFSFGNVAALLIALGEFGLLFTLPLYLQNVLGLSPLSSGLVLAAMAAGAFLAGGAAGQLGRKVSPAAVASTGLALEAAALMVLALVVGASTPAWLIALVLVFYGAGLGLCSAQLTSVILGQVPSELSGQGSALQSTMRQLGSALGAAVLGTILGTAVAARSGGSLTSVPGLPPQLRQELEGQLSPSAGVIIEQVRQGAIHLPPHTIDMVLTGLSQTFAEGTRVTMLVGACFLAIGVVATLLLPRRLESSDVRPPSAQAGKT